tara:strand:- start:3221 stop:4186 length:966 start_codon:yes stop_codon:yes gene_type:complete
MIKRTFIALLVLVGVLSVSAQAGAAFPDKPIKLVVPFTAGGITDNLARVTSEYASDILGEPVVIDNRGGAGGTIGAAVVAKAKADGYTILVGTQGTQATNQFIYKSMPYKYTDFQAVQGLMSSPNVVVLNPSLPYKTLDELVVFAKKNPNKLTYSSPGVGTGAHLAAELFQTVSGIELLHIPFKGSAPSINAVLSGTVDLTFDYLTTTAAHIKAGTLRIVAVTGRERMAEIPDISTMTELGYPKATAESWLGLFAPKGTPEHIILKLQDAYSQAIEDANVQKKLSEFGGVPLHKSSKEFNEFVDAEVVKWERVVEASGAKL